MKCYRPIALIPVMAKNFERVIYNNLNNYLESNNIFTHEQFGFRKGKSTIDALYNFLKKVMTGLDNKQRITAIFMDMSKAFDYVDHYILLNKLEQYGVRGNALNRIKSYLENRVQLTQIARVLQETKHEQTYQSTPKTVKYGVPQGSILGPLLFVVYINDLPKVINQDMILFADDSTAIFTDEDQDTDNYEININKSVESIINWLNNNNLKINLQKTCYISFANINKKTKTLNIQYKGETIEEVKSTKFLGIYIDSGLNWKIQVDHVCKKLNQFSYALYMLRKVANESTLLSVYHAYVGSVLKYGILFWGNSTNRELALKAQKKCIRSISGLGQMDSCRQVFKRLKILTLPSIYILEAAMMIKRDIDNYQTLRSTRHRTELRNIK